MDIFIASQEQYTNVAELAKSEQINAGCSIKFTETKGYPSELYQQLLESKIFIGCLSNNWEYNSGILRMARSAVGAGRKVLLIYPQNGTELSRQLYDKQYARINKIMFRDEDDLVEIIKLTLKDNCNSVENK